VQAFAHGPGRPAPPPLSDPQLAEALEAYRTTGLRRLAGLSVRNATRHYPALYDAIRDASAARETLEITVTDPPAAGPAWEFLRPVRRIELRPDGTAEFHPTSGGAQHAVARVLVRESSRARASVEPDPVGLATFPQAFDRMRDGPSVPFRLALLLYLPDERVRYEIDLTEDALLKDPRAGRLSAARKLKRPPRASWAIDRFVAARSVPLLDARVLEVLAELRSATAEELALPFGVNPAPVRAALGRLVGLGKVHADAEHGLYRVRIEAFQAAAAEAPPFASAAVAPGPVPSEDPLQRELSELMASADASATCPVCGDTLPPGHAGLVCPRCAAEVEQDHRSG
jgi:hypothetical protein